MIKIESEYKNGHLGGSVIIKGYVPIVVEELAQILNQIREQDEELVMMALDRYLDLQGFPQ